MDTNISRGVTVEKILDAATKKIMDYENNPQAPNAEAFVYITNMAMHRHLYKRPILAVSRNSGLGSRISTDPDISASLREYALDQKYKQLFAIMDAFRKVGHFPTTFDGSLPSDNIPGVPERLQIGQTYDFTELYPRRFDRNGAICCCHGKH